MLRNMVVCGGAPLTEEDEEEEEEEEEGEEGIGVANPPLAALHTAGVAARQLLIANVFV